LGGLALTWRIGIIIVTEIHASVNKQNTHNTLQFGQDSEGGITPLGTFCKKKKIPSWQ
jgi:hypothetical protein